MGKNDTFIVEWAKGSGVNFGRAKNQKTSWLEFRKQFKRPTRTKELRYRYDKLSKKDQTTLKAVDGFISCAPCQDNIRRKVHIMPRDIMSLDLDYPTPAICTLIGSGMFGLSEYEFVAHSSRRHTDEEPRLRIYLPVSRPVTPEEHGPLTRILSMLVDTENDPVVWVDEVCARSAQMMFCATASADGDYYHKHNEGPILDPDEIFEWYEENYDDWRVITNLPTYAGEDKLRERADKAEDPLTKRGVVGDFCRAYDVETAMEKWIPGTYEPTDEHSSLPRYSYIGATTTSGVVVYDEARFIYSFHGTDPCCDQLVNAFDMVRIHKFGELDEKMEQDTPPSQHPSYKAMVDHIQEDNDFKAAQTASKYDLAEMFDAYEPEEDDEEDIDSIDTLDDDETDMLADVELLVGSAPAAVPIASGKKPKSKAPKPDTWFPQLETDKYGSIKPTLHNLSMIITNDIRFWGAIAYNEFTGQIVARRNIVEPRIGTVPPFYCKDPVNGDRWQDINDATIRAIIEAPNGDGLAGYGLTVSDRNLRDAVMLAAFNNAFHPVRDYLDDLEWDGTPRVDTFLIKMLRTPDTLYHREISRWALLASVTRIYKPGHKYDYAVVMTGKTGIRKSGLLKALYGNHWFGEIECSLDNKQRIAEEMADKWCGELPELTAFNKSDHNSAKAFMRRTKDDVRMAYDRHVRELPRQQVYWATTNDKTYLKDPTGNRSYWPCDVDRTEQDPIPTWWVEKNREQIWAEAVVMYKKMRAEQPHGDLPLTLSREAQKEAVDKQEAARIHELHEVWTEEMLDWLDEPVTLAVFLHEIGADTAEQFAEDAETTLVLRCAFTNQQAQVHALLKPAVARDHQTAQNVGKAINRIIQDHGWRKHNEGNGARVGGIYGRWIVRDDVGMDDLSTGYRVVGSTEDKKPEDLI